MRTIADKNKGMTIEMGQSLVEYDIDRIYHLPKRYKNIWYYLDGANYRNRPLRSTLLKTLRNLLKEDNAPLPWHGMYCRAMSNEYLTEEIRKKSTWEVSNHHLNLLCAMRLLRKLKQFEIDQMLEVNKGLLAEHPTWHPINVFAVQEYNDDLLEMIDGRCAQLMKAHVTSGNVSSDKLLLRGCEDLAAETYWSNNVASANRRKVEYGKLINRMKDICEFNGGYCYKEDIDANMPEISKGEINLLFKIYGDQIWSEPEYAIFYYKAPNKKERKRFKIPNPEPGKPNRWIFYPKDEERKEA